MKFANKQIEHSVRRVIIAEFPGINSRLVDEIIGDMGYKNKRNKKMTSYCYPSGVSSVRGIKDSISLYCDLFPGQLFGINCKGSLPYVLRDGKIKNEVKRLLQENSSETIVIEKVGKRYVITSH